MGRSVVKQHLYLAIEVEEASIHPFPPWALHQVVSLAWRAQHFGFTTVHGGVDSDDEVHKLHRTRSYYSNR